MRLEDLDEHRNIQRVTHWRNIHGFDGPSEEKARTQRLERYEQIFLDDIAEQEVDSRIWIPIPPKVRAILAYRPTPLYVIEEQEKYVVCVKWEGASPYGNYKLNTIAASVVAAVNEKKDKGLDRIYIGGARGGNTLRTAIPEFCKAGIKVTAYWVKGTSEEQESQKRQMKKWNDTFKDKMVEVHLSDSASKRYAQYEALEEMMYHRRYGEKAKLVMACSAGHVSLHQTIIGTEISKQVNQIVREKEYNPSKAQIVTVCCGVSTNAGGTNLPLWMDYGKRLNARLIQNERCAPLSYGKNVEVCYDPFGILPVEDIIALKSSGVIAASGINYAETSSLVRKLHERSILTPQTISSLKAKRASVEFQEKFEVLPCLEAAHALAYLPKVVEEYNRKLSGNERAIIVCVVTGEERR